MINMHSIYKSQKGTALIITLILLIVLTLIVLSGARNSTLQLRMSSNLQSRVEALQYAQAALDLIVEKANIAKLQIAGDKMCTPSHPEGPCNIPMVDDDGNTIDLTQIEPFKSANGSIELIIQYMGDAYIDDTSYGSMKSNFFHAKAKYDDSDSGRGQATLAIGAKVNVLE